MAAAPPILIWQPGGGIPVGPVSNPPVYSQADVTQLIIGQSYIDVVFGTIQTDDDWVLVACEVYNVTDLAPLNIWPGIITNRTTAGFRLQLNGMPDSNNYYLSWAVSGVNIVPAIASTYLFTGPTSGNFGVNKTFTVKLSASTTLSAPITVTPNDGGAGGSFSPPSVTLSAGSATATFVYIAAAYGAATLSVTNSGTLVDPAPIVYTSIAPIYTFSGPTGGSSGVPSTNFTVLLAGDATLAVPTTITPNDGGAGGTFTPTTVLLVAGVGVHFTYTPISAGAKTISVTNDGGLTNPANLTYTATTPALADGDPVSSWLDSSGNGHTATQTGTARPTFKTNIINGKPVVRFTSSGASTLIITAISGAVPWTVFTVMKALNSSVSMFNILGPAVGPAGVYGPVESGGSIYVSSRIGAATAPVDYSGAFHVLVGKSEPTITSIFSDGTSISSAGPGTVNTANFELIGGAPLIPALVDGDLAEIIVYNVALTDIDRYKIEKYLGTKYGITVSGGGTEVPPDTLPGLVAWWKADSLG